MLKNAITLYEKKRGVRFLTMKLKIVTYLFAALMLVGTAGHVFNPEFYEPMIPDFFPADLANILTALAEFAVGVLLLIPKTRALGGLAFALLMVGFVPFHVWDFFRDDPMVGPQPAPTIRLAIQFLLIYGGIWIYRRTHPVADRTAETGPSEKGE